MANDKSNDGPELIRTWMLSPAATLGSSVRVKGILQEIRARLPSSVRRSLDVIGGEITLALPETSRREFRAASAVITEAVNDAEQLPVIPREIQDILTITATERRRWLDDGRLPSAGTRTVRLGGRARQVTFHVFDPRFVEDILDRDLVTVWREADAEAATEKRRRAALKTKLTRSLKTDGKASRKSKTSDGDAGLAGWEAFERDGLLR